MSAGSWFAGNAVRDGKDHRGWIVGHFMDVGDVRQSGGVEIKWGIHASGEERADWQADGTRTTVLLLVKGRFRVNLSVDSFVLEQEGDYAMWGPGIGHSWRAEEDSVVVTVRWPSALP
jgi:quercetin dioxygenase-like cupin family protein